MIKLWDDFAWEDYLYIDETNRLVYRIHENRIEILQCRSHYRNK